MTPEQWEQYVKRFESCPENCDTCVVKKDCLRRFERTAARCKFYATGAKKEHHRPTPGNPCVEGYGLGDGWKVKPLAIEHVKGCTLVGDGKWRPK
jgi:hypothetical protein